MEMKLITKMISWVPWKGAQDSSGDFSGLVYYQGQDDLKMTLPKVEANLALLPEVLGMAFHRASLCTLGRAHHSFFIYYVHDFLVIWSL